MSFCRLIVAIILVVTLVKASPDGGGGSTIKITSPISVQTKLKMYKPGSYKGLVQKDLARAKELLALYSSKSTGSSWEKNADIDIPLTNSGSHYTAEIGIGTPAKNYQLLVDTGSSNTFLSTLAGYQETSSSKNTTQKTRVAYGSGKFEGFEFTDTVTLGGTSITAQSIGISQKDEGLEDLDGLLGLGPIELTRGTVDGMETVPTVTDNLATQHAITAVLGISYLPSTKPQPEGSSLDFGAPDAGKYTGDVTYVPITQTSPAGNFWGIDQSISYGSDKTSILKLTAGIVDSGTTLLMLATDAYNAYVSATGAKVDQETSLLKVDSADTLQSLFFDIGGTTFEFTANAQIWPRVYNADIGGDSGATYLIISDMHRPSGQGLDFINGIPFMQRFYTVFDTPGKRVGFATTPHTNDTSN